MSDAARLRIAPRQRDWKDFKEPLNPISHRDSRKSNNSLYFKKSNVLFEPKLISKKTGRTRVHDNLKAPQKFQDYNADKASTIILNPALPEKLVRVSSPDFEESPKVEDNPATLVVMMVILGGMVIPGITIAGLVVAGAMVLPLHTLGPS